MSSEKYKATSKDIQTIETYVNQSEKLYEQGNALEILKRFDAKMVVGRSSYYVSEKTEGIYNYYKEQKPRLFEKQKIMGYEALINAAINYCSRHDLID